MGSYELEEADVVTSKQDRAYEVKNAWRLLYRAPFCYLLSPQKSLDVQSLCTLSITHNN